MESQRTRNGANTTLLLEAVQEAMYFIHEDCRCYCRGNFRCSRCKVLDGLREGMENDPGATVAARKALVDYVEQCWRRAVAGGVTEEEITRRISEAAERATEVRYTERSGF